MDCSIGMFLAGMVGSIGMGWYAAKLRIHITYGNPEDLRRELMLYKGLLWKAGLSVDDQKRD